MCSPFFLAGEMVKVDPTVKFQLCPQKISRDVQVHVASTVKKINPRRGKIWSTATKVIVGGNNY